MIVTELKRSGQIASDSFWARTEIPDETKWVMISVVVELGSLDHDFCWRENYVEWIGEDLLHESWK